MKLEHALIVALFLIIVYLFQCRKPKEIEIPKEVHVIDTIFKTDTLVNYIYKEHTNLQLVEVIQDTSNNANRIDLSDTSAFWSTYIYPIKDSLLNGTISAYSQTRPRIDFKYKLKNFTIHDTVLIKDSIYKLQPKRNAFYIGAELSGSQNRFGFSPSFTFTHKKGLNYSVRYDLINKEVGFKFEKKLTFKK